MVNNDQSQIHFLDIEIIKEQDKLATDLRKKPTDTNTLHGRSFLPTALKKQSRVRRTCSSDELYFTLCGDMSDIFRDRQYEKAWIQKRDSRISAKVNVPQESHIPHFFGMNFRILSCKTGVF